MHLNAAFSNMVYARNMSHAHDFFTMLWRHVAATEELNASLPAREKPTPALPVKPLAVLHCI